jgi:hypothetical protein
MDGAISFVLRLDKGGENVFAFKRRVVGEDFVERGAIGDQLQNVCYANSLTTNARAPATLPCLDGNAAQPFRAHILTLLCWRFLNGLRLARFLAGLFEQEA